MLQVRDFIDEQVRSAQELINSAGILAHIFMTPAADENQVTTYSSDQNIGDPVRVIRQAEAKLQSAKTNPGQWQSLREQFYFAEADGLDELLETMDALYAPNLSQFFWECNEFSPLERLMDQIETLQP